MRRRVVVTGMGVVCPVGSSVDEMTSRLLAGDSGIARIRLFDPTGLPTQIAGESRLPERAPLRDRKIAFALEAARQAMESASSCGTAPGGGSGEGAGVAMGVGLELFSMDDLAQMCLPGFELPKTLGERLGFLQTPSDLCVHLMSRDYGLTAPPVVLVSACAAGTDAIGTAMRLIARGKRRFMLAGGTDSMLNPLGVAGFCALHATSTNNDDPEGASRPFDRGRDGFVMGEGAGVLVLETLEDALARGATVHAEVAGYGSSFDAYGVSEPHPEGRGATQAITRALADAHIEAREVDGVNAHGTSTPKNDPVETLALKNALGARAKEIPVVSTKSMIGHLISAAGAVEAIAAIACMERGMIHPTRNLKDPDPLCDLDYVAGAARHHDAKVMLSTSFGFGGQNAAIVLRRGSDATHAG